MRDNFLNNYIVYIQCLCTIFNSFKIAHFLQTVANMNYFTVEARNIIFKFRGEGIFEHCPQEMFKPGRHALLKLFQQLSLVPFSHNCRKHIKVADVIE